MPHHLLILASSQPESNLQRQIGVHMTPTQGTWVVGALIVLFIVLGIRRLLRGGGR